MKKNLQRFGASVLAAAMVAQSVALPAAAETTKIDSSVAQSVAASAASAASAVQSLPKFTSTADLIKQTAQTLAAQGEVHELEQDDAKLEATAQSKAGMSLAALENALADAMYANAAAGKINTEAMVNNSVMEDRLSEYFDQVWNLDEQNVTKERNAIAEHIHHVLQGIHLITRAKSDEMEELQESWMNKI